MHAAANAAALTVMIIRWRTNEETMLHLLQKDIVKMIAKLVLKSKTEVQAWSNLVST